MDMANKGKKFSPDEKVRLLRLHLIEKEPVSDIRDRHGSSKYLRTKENLISTVEYVKNRQGKTMSLWIRGD